MSEIDGLWLFLELLDLAAGVVVALFEVREGAGGVASES